MRTTARRSAALPLLVIGGCSVEQSALHPTGAGAEQIYSLFWVMTIGGGLIFAAVLLCTLWAIYGGSGIRRTLSAEGMIYGAGVFFPAAVLSALLGYGLYLMQESAFASSPTGAPQIAVSGEMWWWRVQYRDAQGRSLESANEVHVPVGETVNLALTTKDVIHSFWAPQLAGKLDMIPGRTNMLSVTATKPGISRGQCAEYCGGAHALMSFVVVAHPADEYAQWLDGEAAPAKAPDTEREKLGQDLFLRSGCGACHAVRGTAAAGTIGPDLTHVGSRKSLGAATLNNDEASFKRWIVDNQHIKPENGMPPYRIFTEAELDALAAYLDGLA
ncbi:cytochrome c oxidase subunit II [Mangrovicella endophytica]|uniref:cytochrome c oxidase subunit II n=1 Tax=Mangrovicella endophytica TaxID=2066697 RepID=UPI000C9E34BA|nr:c-type cytochrome [Mangrovicella endophytica]